jgi:hypothetical protein
VTAPAPAALTESDQAPMDCGECDTTAIAEWFAMARTWEWAAAVSAQSVFAWLGLDPAKAPTFTGLLVPPPAEAGPHT